MADPKYQTNPVTVNFIDTSPAVSQSIPVSSTNPLPVTLTSGATDQDVNLVGINGAAPVVGHGVAAAALDGLAVGFEALVDHGPAAEYNPLSKVPDPSCQDFCCQTPFIGRSELGPDFF